jgi:CheY-like chemotaxis protein
MNICGNMAGDGKTPAFFFRVPMPCVLIVEDDEDVRDFMDVLLQASGYETMTAANGAIGIEMMQHRKPCMVLLDMMMPVMDGWTFRSRQLADPALSAVPVVCVTALFEPRVVAERLKLRCLSKPVDFDRLLAEVSAACNSGR